MIGIIISLSAERVFSILDYIVDDYGSAVERGHVKDEYEFEEIKGFARAISEGGYTFGDTLKAGYPQK